MVGDDDEKSTKEFNTRTGNDQQSKSPKFILKFSYQPEEICESLELDLILIKLALNNIIKLK